MYYFRAVKLMKTAATRFVLYVIGLTLLCIGLQALVYSQLGDTARLKTGFLLLSIFVVTTLAVHLFLLKSSEGKPQVFIRAFLGTTMGKFLLYLSVLTGFLMYGPETPKVLALHFLFYYAVFTVLEVSMLYSEIRKMK